jgi:hypothetical protein
MKLKPFPSIRNDGANFSDDIEMFTGILVYNLTVSRILLIDFKSTINLNDLDYFCLYIGTLHGPVIRKLSIVFIKKSGKISFAISDVIENNNYKKYIVELITIKKLNSIFDQVVKNLK